MSGDEVMTIKITCDRFKYYAAYILAWHQHQQAQTRVSRERLSLRVWEYGQHWQTCPECKAEIQRRNNGPANPSNPTPISYEFASDVIGW